MLTDWELWACANAIQRRFGAAAPGHAGERIEALETAGDHIVASNWRAIATRARQLSAAERRVQ